MSNPTLEPDDTEPGQVVHDVGDTLPPEHPAATEGPVSAGEVISGEGGIAPAMPAGAEPVTGDHAGGPPDDNT